MRFLYYMRNTVKMIDDANINLRHTKECLYLSEGSGGGGGGGLRRPLRHLRRLHQPDHRYDQGQYLAAASLTSNF